jgi:WD repeat-containing protein 11
LANALLQPQSPGTLVLELDWLSTRTTKDDPLVLCIAGADSSFRLIEVNMYVILIITTINFIYVH